MKSPDHLRACADRLTRSTRSPDVLDVCEALLEMLNRQDRPRPPVERREYIREYMRAYRKRKREGAGG